MHDKGGHLADSCQLPGRGKLLGEFKVEQGRSGLPGHDLHQVEIFVHELFTRVNRLSEQDKAFQGLFKEQRHSELYLVMG